MDLQAVVSGTQESRVEALRQILDYPLKRRDPEGSRFWFLRPGADEDEAEDTCPIAVGFYSELDGLTDGDIKQFLTADEQQREIYGHYTGRIIPNQPVMYLLLPESPLSQFGRGAGGEGGRVAMILPTDGKLRQRQIQTFSWSDEDLQARLNRLRQDTLARTNRMKDAALSVIPLVEWAFYKPITTAKELAQKLAEVSRRIERVIPDVYRAEPNDGYLRGLLRSFQKELLPTLKLEPENEKDYSFADIYAQTIAYGLFTARVFSYTIDERRSRSPQPPLKRGASERETDFNREDAWELLPETNPFLRRLFRDVSKAVGEYDREAASDESPVIADELIDAISEVVSILRAAKMDAILEDFRAKMNREDIVIRFYEDFLAAYKPQMRERRGVYYTPEPVVSYMVRSVDILLKEKFNKPLGLADLEVMILDPACGTGTFLLWIFQLIHQRFQENPDALTEGLEDRSWSGYVKDRLLPRIFGFELLMAPYAIAHLKLGLFLEETGYRFDGGKRLSVYLVNSLDSVSNQNFHQLSFEAIEATLVNESLEASRVKETEPIMLVIGNPPYSIQSQNLTSSARAWVDPYRFVDGQPIRERNALQFEKNIQDDYIKFIRFAQYRIDQTGYGIVAYVSNHSFIDGRSFRGMRQSLLNSFSELNIFNLHGNYNKKEKSPDGSIDENIFDIQQGVSVSFFIKQKAFEDLKQIQYAELYGRREPSSSSYLKEGKYEWLSKNSVQTNTWVNLNPISPLYSFIPTDNDTYAEYEAFPSLADIMPINSMGVKTNRDGMVIDWNKDPILERVERFRGSLLSNSEICKDLSIPEKKGWNITSARASLKGQDLEKFITKILYRPFDTRTIFYHHSLVFSRAYPTMRHILAGENIGLVVNRQVNDEFKHILCSTILVNDCTASAATKERSHLFPLYVYENFEFGYEDLKLEAFKKPNLNQVSLQYLFSGLAEVPSPEEIFNYIYAVLHSSKYRCRYKEFLKTDFPRIPPISNKMLFSQLVQLGEELIALHLMKSPKLDTLTSQFLGDRNPIVDTGHPKYSNGKIIINKKGDGFTGVPEKVWNFYVGGYQVCQKWLKDRKGRTLSQEDITHYQRIIVVLQETIRLMQQIDEAIPGFPLP